VNFDPLVPEVTTVEIVTFYVEKSAYSREYLRKFWINLHQIFGFDRHMYGDYYIDILFAVAQGTLLW